MTIRDMSLTTILVRTDTGTAAMRDRKSKLTPKLRSVLFLIDGQQTLGQLLDRAGTLHEVLANQLAELIALEHIREVPSGDGSTGYDAEATRPTGSMKHTRPADLSPLMAAKMQLLTRLESVAGAESDLLGAELIDARTLGELATNAKMVSVALEPIVGADVSRQWWTEAKAILLAWRDMNSPQSK